MNKISLRERFQNTFNKKEKSTNSTLSNEPRQNIVNDKSDIDQVEESVDVRIAAAERKDQNVNADKTRSDYIVLQKDVKERNDRFNRQEDFMRHMIFGSEFEDERKYNSKRTVSDFLGFDYCIPPKQRSIQAKLFGTYQSWLDKDRQLQEEEMQSMHELSGSDQPLNINDLTYPTNYAGDDSYENYYWTIKDMRQTELKYQQILNIPDSALVIDGNVAFGKTNEDETPSSFERRLSTNSLGDFGADINLTKRSGTKQMFSDFAKRLARRRSSSLNDIDTNNDQDSNRLRPKSRMNFLSINANKLKTLRRR